MKILFLIDSLETSLPRDQNYIIKHMADKGHQVTILTSRNSRYEKYDKTFFPNVKIIRAPIIFKLSKIKFFFHPFMFFWLKKYDVVHSFTFFTISSLIGPFFRAKKYFLRSEILDSNRVNQKKTKHVLYRALVFYYKLFYSDVYGYSPEESTILRALGFSKNKVFTLPLMVEVSKYKTCVPQKDIFQKPPVLGTIGRITNVKGIHNLVGMLRISIKLSNSQFTFILAGRIDDNAYAKKVLSELRNLLSDKFCYLGEVATPEEFYKKLDIVIVPSIARETGAIVTLEAMAAGKVVVANNLYPMNTYIKDSVNGLLYDDIESAGIKISNLLLEPKIRIELANNALKFVKSHDALLICNKLEARYITHI